VRATFDVPEGDFDVVAPAASLTVRALATNTTFAATISRRSPSADPDTRTVRAEVDIPDPDRQIPVNTTGEIRIEVGQPAPATAIPIDAASINGSKAVVFVVENGVAHKAAFTVLGERESTLYVERALRPDTQVVTEGRSLLAENDRVAAKVVAFAAASSSSPREKR
jgi:multidrug efflux pump subunit AcrA (membrane-fusion protein)